MNPPTAIQISESTLYSIIAALGVLSAVLLVVLVLAVVMMLRISRLSKALAATSDEELRTKLLQQSTWWPRFRFRTMLVLVTLVAVGLGMFVAEWNRARRQGQIVDALESAGYSISTHYRLGIFGQSMVAQLLCHWVHPDFGCTITSLSVWKYGDSMVTDSDLSNIAQLKSLVALSVVSSEFTSEGVKELATLPNISRLSVGGCKLDKDTISTIATMPNLELLELDSAGLNGEELDSLRDCSSLDILSLPDNDISAAGLAVLRKLGNIKTIELSDSYQNWRFSDEYPDNVQFRHTDDDSWYSRWEFDDNRPYLSTNSVRGFSGGGGGTF